MFYYSRLYVLQNCAVATDVLDLLDMSFSHTKACNALGLNHCQMAASADGLATSLVSQAVGTHRDIHC